MDTIIYSHTRPVFTSAIKEIIANTDKDQITAILTDSDSQIVYCEDLAAYGGKVTIYDVGILIEADLVAKSAHYGEYTLTMGEDAAVIKAVYCRYETDSPCPGKGMFLTTMHRQVVFGDSEYSIAMLPQNEGEAVRTTCLYITDKGAARRADYSGDNSPLQPTAAGLVLGSFADLLAKVKERESSGSLALPISAASDIATETTGTAQPSQPSVSDPDIYGNPVRLAAVSFSVGDRMKTYFFRPGKADIAFYFRNCFNAYDIVPVKARIKKKTSVSSSTAVVRHRYTQYDKSTDTVYECEIAPASQAEAEAFAEIAASDEVYAGVIFDPPRECVITDHTVETSNDRDSQTVIKITFRCTDSRPAMEAGLSKAFTSDEGVFSPPYTPEYS